MNSGIFELNWANVKSALVLGGLTAIIAGASYVTGIGNFWAVDGHALVNAIGMSFLVAILSTIQSLLTTSKGNFVGAVNIK